MKGVFRAMLELRVRRDLPLTRSAHTQLDRPWIGHQTRRNQETKARQALLAQDPGLRFEPIPEAPPSPENLAQSRFHTQPVHSETGLADVFALAHAPSPNASITAKS
ncbi:MAG: hypothetical protein K7J46_15475 [Bryobacter sp.]|nr:hypothetical protein [Bryobacter sp. CoA8 C33]